MSVPLIQRIALGFGGDDATELRVRIFRLICALAAGLCLLVVAPLNLMQTLPWGVHLANGALGLAGGICYWQSCRGRHFIGSFFVLLVAVLDLVWFLNAGSDGSVTHYFYPVMLFVITLFQGRSRWMIALGLWLNVGLLYVLEHFFPSWVTPFPGVLDHLVDLETGIFCSFTALVAVTGFILTNYNREQRRVAETAARLAASEAEYREIFNSTSDALFVHAADGRVLDVNEQACSLFGLSREALLRAGVNDYSLNESPYSQSEAQVFIDRAMRGQSQLFEWRSKRANGELFWSEVALRRWEIGGDQRVIASVRDITQRKQDQESLRFSEERMRLAIWASDQSWFDTNLQTGNAQTSPEYSRILGYEHGELQTSLAMWRERIHPDDRPELERIFQHALKTREIGTMEYRLRTKAGTWKWIRSVGKVVELDAAGRPLRMVGTHMDISARKELEAQLLHSQRLEAVGTLAGGVAHDLNNILTPMLMASGLLREKLTEAKDRELMSLIEDGGRRGAAIVKQLLAFSRNLTQNRVPVDLGQLLIEVGQLLRATFPPEITVVVTAAAGQGRVEADPNQLHQVLMNLCVNARDAMPAGGTLTLGLDRADQVAGPAAKAGPHLVITVADTGEGMAPEIMGQIFDPFFTTKPQGKGTGLGLASVHGIIKAHRGFVRVESQPGRGTVFRVFLPAREDWGMELAPVTAAVTPPPAEPLANTCILVVDDEPAVLLVTSRLLTRMGHQVIQAASGPEALQLLERHRAAVTIVITDFAMPGMDGPALVPLLRAISPALRVIGVSGQNQDHRMEALRVLGFSEVLSKPYEWEDLVHVIQRQIGALDRPA